MKKYNKNAPRPYRRTGTVVLCVQCGNEIYQKKLRPRKYCSNLCAYSDPSQLEVLKKQGFQKGHKSTKGKKFPERSGRNHHAWVGGRVKHTAGYIEQLVPGRGYILEHRLVMEKHIGRILKSKEVVHHVNEIRDDNRIKNLMLFKCNADHLKYHAKMRRK